MAVCGVILIKIIGTTTTLIFIFNIFRKIIYILADLIEVRIFFIITFFEIV